MSQIDDTDDCSEFELQLRFTGALASFPLSAPPDAMMLHQRLRRRRVRARLAGLFGLIIMVSLIVMVGVAGSSDPTSATMALYGRDDAAVSQGELSADAKVIRDRLHAIGDDSARVSEDDGAIVVTGRTVGLADPTSVLTEFPALLVMPVVCQSGPFGGVTPSSPGTAPLSCLYTPDAVEPDSPDPAHAWAEEIAAALQSGPLSIPLELARAA
jgi:hypothetical protein